MNTELVQLMKRTVDRFNISSETYYHAVLLFNVIQLKTNSEAQPEYFTIPIRKRELCWDSESDSDYENDCLPEPST